MKKEISGLVEYEGEIVIFYLAPCEDVDGCWILRDKHGDLWTHQSDTPDEIEDMFGYGYYESLKHYRSQEGQHPWPWE